LTILNRNANRYSPVESSTKVVASGHWAKEKGLPEGVGAIFACADSMAVRKDLFDVWAESKVPVFFDGRMGALVCDVYCVTKPKAASYSQSLFSDSEAFGARCTERSTFFSAGLAASIMSAGFAAHLRQGKVPLRVSAALGSKFDFECAETFG
jgi:hypothetical protein